ncbi:MAG: hypothetical protein AB7I19_02265 [Planctomycetota bacterium]
MTSTPPRVPLDVWLKLGAPLFLVALALLIWIEPWLPGADWIERNLGQTAVLRFAVGFGFLYLALTILEQRRLGSLFRQVLEQFKRFHSQQNPKTAESAARLDAVAMLITALGGTDTEVAENAHRHLVRLTGTDLGKDAAAWRGWLAQARQQSGGAPTTD